MPAAFGARIQMINGIAPAFADCSINAKPSYALMWFLNRKFQFGFKGYDSLEGKEPVGTLYETMMYSACVENSPVIPVALLTASDARTWFSDAGVLICRPGSVADCLMSVALKGGHNAEHHNHNDLGSYVVVYGDETLLLDPGGEIYTARTFSPKRYESKLLSSFGHPVPVVAGKLQRTGAKAAAKILSSEFTDTADSLTMDITSAYDCPELKSLVRRFDFRRSTSASLTITDEVSFTKPQTFETALITLLPGGPVSEMHSTTIINGNIQRANKKRFIITGKKGKASVTIDANGIPFDVKTEAIEENAEAKPNRIGIKLRQPVESATVTIVIEAR